MAAYRKADSYNCQMRKSEIELTSFLHRLLQERREYLHGRARVPKKLHDKICEIAKAIEESRRTLLV